MRSNRLGRASSQWVLTKGEDWGLHPGARMIPPLAEGGLPGSTVSHPSDVRLCGRDFRYGILMEFGVPLRE